MSISSVDSSIAGSTSRSCYSYNKFQRVRNSARVRKFVYLSMYKLAGVKFRTFLTRYFQIFKPSNFRARLALQTQTSKFQISTSKLSNFHLRVRTTSLGHHPLFPLVQNTGIDMFHISNVKTSSPASEASETISMSDIAASHYKIEC